MWIHKYMKSHCDYCPKTLYCQHTHRCNTGNIILWDILCPEIMYTILVNYYKTCVHF